MIEKIPTIHKFAKGKFPKGDSIFICTSEKNPELIGKLDGKNISCQPNKIIDSIAKAVSEVIAEKGQQ